MYLDSILDEILSYLQFIFVIATFVLVLYEFKEVLKYEKSNESTQGQKSFQTDVCRQKEDQC